MRSFLLCLLLGLFSIASARSVQGNKLLVVIEDEAERDKYSQFWSDLESRGYDITYRPPKDTSLSLFALGEPAYSHLLLLPPKTRGLGPALTPGLIVEFINAGSNVLLALSGGDSSVPSAISSLLQEFDVQLPPERNSAVVDHFNYDVKSSSETHDVLLLESGKMSRTDVANFFAVDGLVALPRAVGQVLGNASPLLASVIKGSSTAYTYNPKERDSDEEPFATGSQISVVTVFQALNSARLAILGSSEALEDKWFDATIQLKGQQESKSANKAFANALSGWAFKEVGVLKVNSVVHFLDEELSGGETKQVIGLANDGIELDPSIYRIKNDVQYAISISNWEKDHWAPFTPPPGDSVQLEVSMLSPFHRLNLVSTSTEENATVYSQSFKLPDQHGIFNFFVEYKRPFYTNLEEKRTVTVRHFAHDEWPRSFAISGAWPWISGIWVTVAGFIGFVAIWLYSAPARPQRDLKTSGKR